jgi:hypothetical protein
MFKKLIRIVCVALVPVLGYYFVNCDSGPATGDVKTKFSVNLVGNGAFCDEFFDNSHGMTLTVTVDKVVDPNTGQLALHDVDVIQVDNDFFGETYDLNIPESGGFAITVQLTSTTCMSCCDFECFDNERTGIPVLRDLRTFTSDPGGVIQFNLDILACSCC